MEKNNAKIFFISWCNRQGCWLFACLLYVSVCELALLTQLSYRPVSIQYFSFSKHFFSFMFFFLLRRFFFSSNFRCRGSSATSRSTHKISFVRCLEVRPIIFELYFVMCLHFICAAAAAHMWTFFNFWALWAEASLASLGWMMTQRRKQLSSVQTDSFIIIWSRANFAFKLFKHHARSFPTCQVDILPRPPTFISSSSHLHLFESPLGAKLMASKFTEPDFLVS